MLVEALPTDSTGAFQAAVAKKVGHPAERLELTLGEKAEATSLSELPLLPSNASRPLPFGFRLGQG